MKVNRAISRPIHVEVSDPISLDNMEEIAIWCDGQIQRPLLEICGPEIVFISRPSGDTEYGMIGQRIIKHGPHKFTKSNEGDFQLNYALIEGE